MSHRHCCETDGSGSGWWGGLVALVVGLVALVAFAVVRAAGQAFAAVAAFAGDLVQALVMAAAVSLVGALVVVGLAWTTVRRQPEREPENYRTSGDFPDELEARSAPIGALLDGTPAPLNPSLEVPPVPVDVEVVEVRRDT